MPQSNYEAVDRAAGEAPVRHNAAGWRTVTDRREVAGWSNFAGWIASKRVTLVALVLIAASVGLNSYVLSRGFFQLDDFAIGGLSAHSFTAHMLFQNYAGHLMPAVFALAWALTHTGNGYDWGLWDGSLVALQALAGLAMLRALRTLAGNRMLVLIPLGVFLFTPMALTDLSWWAVGVQAVPMQLALALAVDQHVRYLRTRRIRNVFFALMWICFGLAWYEKSVAIPVLLFALTSAYLVPGSWPEGMRTALRRYWLAWTLYGAALIAEIIIYVSSLSATHGRVQVPQASTALTFSWDLLRNTFVATALGGPWHWTLVPGVSRSWALYAIAAPPTALLVLAWVFAALVVIASLWYRTEAWRGWIILLGWLVLADILPIVLGRLAVFGTLASTQTMYVTDAAPILAICLAIAFLPLRDEQNPYRVSPPRLWPHATPLAAALVLPLLAGAVWSATSYRAELHPANSRSYLVTASWALKHAPSGAVIDPSQIPNQMAWVLLGPPTEIQNALAPLVDQVSGQNFRFTSRPAGLVPSFLIFDTQGRLHPVTIAGPDSLPLRRQSECVPTASGLQLQLGATVYALPTELQLGYFAEQPTTVTVTFGGHQYPLSMPATRLAYIYLPVEGPGNTITITPVTPDPKVCIGAATVGNAQPTATGTPIPAFPLRG